MGELNEKGLHLSDTNNKVIVLLVIIVLLGISVFKLSDRVKVTEDTLQRIESELVQKKVIVDVNQCC